MKRMLINAIDPEESRIAVVEDGVLQELHVELANRESYLGNIYKGKVVNIEPSIGAAFVAFGGRVNGFLHVSDVLPAYGRDDFRLEDVIEGRARVDVDDGPESMQQALADEDDEAANAKSGKAPRRGAKKASTRPGDEADSEASDANEVDRAAADSATADSATADSAPADGAPADGAPADGATADSAPADGATADGDAADSDPTEQDSAGQESRGQVADEQATDGHDTSDRLKVPTGSDEAGDSRAIEEDAAETSPGDDLHDDLDDGVDAQAPVIEPILDVEVAADDSHDDQSDDDESEDDADAGEGGFGFGDGIDERPLAMAAADPGDESEPTAPQSAAPALAGSADSRDRDSGDGSSSSSDSSSSDSSSSESSSRESGDRDAGDESRAGTFADAQAETGVVAPRKRRSRSRKAKARKAAQPGDELGQGADQGPRREPGDELPQSDQKPVSEARKPEVRKRSRRGAGGNEGRGGNDRRPRGQRPTIDQLLKKGQEVVVQITKEGIGNKGPTLTTYVSLPGRCLVLMPSLPKCGVSRKIEDGGERRRLKRIVKALDETSGGAIGFIVRTAGINKSLEDLQRDRDYLKKIWEMVAQRLKLTKAPALLYQESDLVLKAMRDQFTPDIADVVVDSEDVFMRIRDFAEKLMPLMAERIKRHSVTTPLFHSFGIEKDVEALYQPKIDLSNGASIVIDQAEALVAIDVNSGKYKAGGDSDDTAHRTNMESIPEIVRQLRLRDLGGLIIIDFIDMLHEKHRRAVERRIIDALRGDRARIKVGRISPFGMMEITRQRVGPGLKRTVFMQCPHCKGAGWSRTVQSKALSVLRESRALVNLKGYSMLQVFVAPPVSDYLVNYKRRAVLDLEDAVGKSIVFRPEQSYPIDVVHYRFLTGDGQEARIAIPAGLGVKA